MLAINHAATGILLGSYLPLPIALPVAFASHFVMDSLPHFGIDKSNRDKSNFYRLVIYLDIFLTLLLTVSFFHYTSWLSGAYHSWGIMLSGLVAVGPDLTHVEYWFKNGRTMNVETKGLFSSYHKTLHHRESLRGIYPEAISAAGLVGWIFYRL
jgi:hypothetical protein